MVKIDVTSDDLMGMSDHNGSTDEAGKLSEEDFLDSNDSLSDKLGDTSNVVTNKGSFLIDNILASQNKEKYLKLFDMIETII